MTFPRSMPSLVTMILAFAGQYLLAFPPLMAEQRIRVMAYNLENLFDHLDDPRTNDQAYLPLAWKASHKEHAKSCPRKGHYRQECLELDWNEAAVSAKMANLAKVILSVNAGRGPDLLLVSEVENAAILKQFNDTYLKAAGYKTLVHADSPDPRGIDTAMLTRLPLVGEARLHELTLPGKKTKRTRGILQARFRLNSGAILTAFALHFPSPRHPSEQRVAALKQLTKLAKAAATDSAVVIAGGDFNVTHRYDSEIYRALASSQWDVSHLVGCHQCLGTHSYRGSWSFLDALMLYRQNSEVQSAKTSKSWQFDAKSIQVVSDLALDHVNRLGQPRSFEVKSATGASDHLPIYAELYSSEASQPKLPVAGKNE